MRLRFVEGAGSPQHFFHFMWGYLMPALHAILAEQAATRVYEFETCGPVMDPKIGELCDRLGILHRIRPDDSSSLPSISVPRWDLWLRGPRRTRIRMRVLAAMHRSGLPIPALGQIEQSVNRVLEAVIEAEPGERAAHWLLVKRSEEPDFYAGDGPANRPGYGTGRRAIANFDELLDDLKRRGCPVRAYEPGRDSLVQQIRTFHEAAGIIAIRGAEFANVAFMRPRTRAVMLVTPMQPENNFAANLATARCVRFRPLPVDSNYPTVSAERIAREIA